MKRIFTWFLGVCFLSCYHLSEAQTVKNQICIGGTQDDGLGNILYSMGDSMFIITASSMSSDGDFNMYVPSPDGNSYFPNEWLLKLDKNLNVVWKRNINGDFPQSSGVSVKANSNGIFLRADQKVKTSPSDSFWVFSMKKLDFNNNTIWTKNNIDTLSTETYDTYLKDDGSTILVKTDSSDARGLKRFSVSKISNSGNRDLSVKLNLRNIFPLDNGMFVTENFYLTNISVISSNSIHIFIYHTKALFGTIDSVFTHIIQIDQTNGNVQHTNTFFNARYVMPLLLPNNTMLLMPDTTNYYIYDIATYQLTTKSLSIPNSKNARFFYEYPSTITRDHISFDIERNSFNNISNDNYIYLLLAADSAYASSVMRKYYVTKTDFSGNILWKSFLGQRDDGTTFGIINNGLVFLNQNNNPILSSDFGADYANVITKVDKNTGAFLWQYTRKIDTLSFNGYKYSNSRSAGYPFYKFTRSAFDSLIYDEMEYQNITTGSGSIFQSLAAVNMNTGKEVSNTFINIPTDSSFNYGYVVTSDDNIMGIGESKKRSCAHQSGSSTNYDLHLVLVGMSHNTILGKAYIDNNNNNAYNAGTDLLFTQGYVKSAKGNLNAISYLTEGSYNNQVDTGTYNSTFSGYNNYFNVSPVSKTTSHTSFGNVDTVDFALHPKGNINDLRVTLINTWVTRPGFTNSYEAVYTNEGTTVMNNASIAIVLDSRLIYNSASPVPTGSSGDTLKWNLSSLTPSQSGKIKINFTGKTSPQLNAGDSLLSNAWISPVVNDSTPSDNSFTLTDIARSSFDPNDKNVEANAALTPTQITNGDYITYRVRFQNTGNYYAANVIILDTLENNLDWNSLQIISASHSGLQTTVKNNNVVEFRFSNINLPPLSQSADSSHGYVVFKIKPKSSLVAGNTIKNTAHITFDFNLPVNTNTATVRVLNVTATLNNHNKEGDISLYPNPNRGTFILNFKAIRNFPMDVRMYDVTGKEIFSQSIPHHDQTQVQLNENNLPAGYYNVVVSSGSDIWNKKIIIVK